MLSLVLKLGDQIKIGDDIIIKLQSETRANLAIDAPREMKIERIQSSESKEPQPKNDAAPAAGKKKVYVVRNTEK